MYDGKTGKNALFLCSLSFVNKNGNYILKRIETNKVLKECYLIGQDNAIYTFSTKFKCLYQYRTKPIKATETKMFLRYKNT